MNARAEQIAGIKQMLINDLQNQTPAETPEDPAAPVETPEEPVAPVETPVEPELPAAAELEDPNAPAEEEEPDIHDIHQLASAIGVDAEYMYGLQIPMPEGQDPITLGQYKDMVQQQGETGAAENRLNTERELFQQEKQRYEAEMSNRMQAMQQVPQEVQEAEARQQALALQYQSIDWAALEQQDAGQAALQKQNLSTAFNQAGQEVEAARNRQAALQQQYMAGTRQEEEAKLLLAIEAWRDPKVREKGTASVSKLMADYGFAPNEIGNVMDHRAIRIMNDLARYREQAGDMNPALKKVKQAPKALRPGGRQAKVKPTALKEAKERLARAGPAKRRQAEIDVAKALLSS
jgi:hypothetical protein